MRNKNKTLICKTCGATYYPQYGRPESKFCSHACYIRNRWGDKAPPTPCAVCGKPCTSTGKRSQVCCSRPCAEVLKIGRPNPSASNIEKRPCHYCGKQVVRAASNFHSDRVFCNSHCRGLWVSKNIIQDAHWAWMGGAVKARGAGWANARRECRRLSRGRCEMCGAVANHVHHKIPIRCFDSPELAHDQSNLVVLCSSCHPKAEKQFRDALPLLSLCRNPNSKPLVAYDGH